MLILKECRYRLYIMNDKDDCYTDYKQKKWVRLEKPKHPECYSLEEVCCVPTVEGGPEG